MTDLDRSYSVVFGPNMDRSVSFKSHPIRQIKWTADENSIPNALTATQQDLWSAFSQLSSQAQLELFGEAGVPVYMDEAFFRVLLYAVPRYMARRGIVTLIMDFPFAKPDDRIVVNTYALDFVEATRVDVFETTLWGERERFPRVTLGPRIHLRSEEHTSE